MRIIFDTNPSDFNVIGSRCFYFRKRDRLVGLCGGL
jgi:hypothetical protein